MARLLVNPEQAIDLAAASGRALVTRASMLMAYALNAANQAKDAAYHLPGFVQFVDAPQDLSPEEMEKFRVDYRNWIVGNGLRALLEDTETFLNALYRIAIDAERHLHRMSDGKAKKLIVDFDKMGVSGKLAVLKQRYRFDTGFSQYVRSLTQARNCLTHRHGIVGAEDCKPGGALELTWLGMDAKITEGDGTEHVISLETLGPFDSSKFSEEGTPQLTAIMVDRHLRFGKGERVTVPARSLQEICSMISYTCLKLRQLMLNWLLQQGVRVNNGKLVPDPAATLSLSYDAAQ
jgi:hypothetical protein